MAARDSGFLQIHCATCQEITDSVLIAYRLAEHEDIRVPAILTWMVFICPLPVNQLTCLMQKKLPPLSVSLIQRTCNLKVVHH